MKKKKNFWIIPFLIMSIFLVYTIDNCKKDDSGNGNNLNVTDTVGNIYHAVTIGSQTWMIENLKTTKYNDGSAIPLVTESGAWPKLTTPGYCWYNNDETINKNPYGALYNWYAVNTGKLCPKGWHVPADAEWALLVLDLGVDSTAGGKLKEAGTLHWVSPNTRADNSSGFTALPGGSHYNNDVFYLNGKYGWWWSTTVSSTTQAWHEYLVYNSGAISRTAANYNLGFSVRCLKDN
jgi:uncharacterized protein (TIGR02145 family)